jgi:hypothetical protein
MSWPFITRQQLLDLGLNVFALDLLLKSLETVAAKIAFETEYRGTRWRVSVERVTGPVTADGEQAS